MTPLKKRRLDRESLGLETSPFAMSTPITPTASCPGDVFPSVFQTHADHAISEGEKSDCESASGDTETQLKSQLSNVLPSTPNGFRSHVPIMPQDNLFEASTY